MSPGARVGRIGFAVWIVLQLLAARAGAGEVPFTADHWDLSRGRVVEHLERQALVGSAQLLDLEFTDGVIEVDLALTGSRGYPGVQFRIQAPGEFEELYVRPHVLDRFPTALQYAPAFHGITGWQLYSGPGFTAPGALRAGEWVTLRIEVLGDRARVFWGDLQQPALVIPELKRGAGAGSVALRNASPGVACFSRFRISTDPPAAFETPLPPDPPPGLITDWEISQAFPVSSIDRQLHPRDQGLEGIEWRRVSPDSGGLVDVARHLGRTGREPDLVLARTVLQAEQPEVREIAFGYSDLVDVFLNGRALFSGNSAYQSRAPGFQGIVGRNDALYLPLEAGANELLLMVTESFGGWGFTAQDPDAVLLAEGIQPAWHVKEGFAVPEAVVYDPRREVLYVSNFDFYRQGPAGRDQAVSRLSTDGSRLEACWVAGLRNPTGLTVHGKRLWVVERTGLAEIDPRKGRIVARHAASEPGFLNDVAADPEGRLYVSDSRKGAILRFAKGSFETWLEGPEVGRPNGLLVREGELLWGDSAARCIRAADLETRELRGVARLGPGIIDGLQAASGGDLLVSHNEGRIYRITPAGQVTRILDLSNVTRCADFAYLPREGLLVIPTFAGNDVRAYRLPKEP